MLKHSKNLLNYRKIQRLEQQAQIFRSMQNMPMMQQPRNIPPPPTQPIQPDILNMLTNMQMEINHLKKPRE